VLVLVEPASLLGARWRRGAGLRGLQGDRGRGRRLGPPPRRPTSRPRRVRRPKTSPWLFPGDRPSQPISAYQLAERLPQVGLHPAQNRSTALFGLAAELPAAVLARLLGIHIKVAVERQHASAGDWTTYAADYSRREPTPAEDPDPPLRHSGERDAFRQLQ
jgi:hypothetical protein